MYFFLLPKWPETDEEEEDVLTFLITVLLFDGLVLFCERCWSYESFVGTQNDLFGNFNCFGRSELSTLLQASSPMANPFGTFKMAAPFGKFNLYNGRLCLMTARS